MKVAIIGAGIGGLTTAIALKQAGIDAEIFEAARIEAGGLAFFHVVKCHAGLSKTGHFRRSQKCRFRN